MKRAGIREPKLIGVWDDHLSDRDTPIPRNRWCLPGGAVLVIIADLAVQALPGAQELQLGVLTSALGGPFFLYVLFRNRQWFL